MKLFLDQDVYALTARFLREIGHDIVTAAEAGLSRVADRNLLARSAAEGRVLVTRDKDFGNLVFVERLGAGVLFLRLTPSTLESVHAELRRVLETHSESELRNAFVVVEPGQHRIRHLLAEESQQ